MKSCCFFIANAPQLSYRMARTKVTPHLGKRGGETRILWMRMVTKVETRKQRPSPPVHPPTPAKEAPLQAEEIMRWIAEVGQLKGVGRSPSSLPTQQLAQMAVEAGSSMWGKEETVRRKLWLTMRDKALQKEFLQAGKVKKTRKYWCGTVALWEIWQFQKSTELLIRKIPFSWLVHKITFEVGRYDLHFQRSAIIYLQEAAEAYVVGLMGRCQPLCHTCKKGDKYAQGHSVSLLHLGRASKILKSSSLQANLLIVRCVGSLFVFQYRGRERKWEEALH